jgi:hypothetical protein
MPICRETEPGLDRLSYDERHRSRCHLDEDTKRHEAERLLTEVLVEAV